LSASSEKGPQSLLDIIEPWIPRDLLEKLILNPVGVGLIMITAGAFLKQTHAPARAVLRPATFDPSQPDRSLYSPNQGAVMVPESAGLDLLIWKIPLPISVGDVATYLDWMKQLFTFGGQLTGPLGNFIGLLMPDFKSLEGSKQPFVINVYLSDVLVLAGGGLIGGSALSSLTTVLPKL